MATIVVGTNSYVTLAEFDAYVECIINGQDGAPIDTKQRAIITAFNIFQRTKWKGTKTGGDAQTAAWPRTGVTCNGQAIDPATVPQRIIDGQIEYANAIIVSTALADSPTGAASTGIRRVQAGTAQVEFFNNNPNLDIASQRRFPTAVFELVSCLLDLASFQAVQLVSGLDGKSSFDAENQYTLSDGYP